jgi:hypothetical protein
MSIAPVPSVAGMIDVVARPLVQHRWRNAATFCFGDRDAEVPWVNAR